MGPTLTQRAAAMRRAPVQFRSAARVERMLDAAAQLVGDIGYEATTTSLIAARARVSIGSLYQFFPDKKAVFRALALRHLDAFIEHLEQLLSERGLDNWSSAVDTCVDAYVDAYRTLPGFTGFGDSVDECLLEPGRHNHDVLTERLVEVVAPQYGATASEGVRLIALVSVEIGDALLKLAFRRDPHGDAAVVAEAKAAICDHLARNLPHDGAVPVGRTDGRQRVAQLGP